MGDAIQDHVAVVTGAGRGLGRAVAMALAANGVTVALVARSPEQLAQTASAIRAAGGAAACYPTDVSQAPAVAALASRVEAELGAPAILVNVAGMFGPFELVKDVDADEWIRTIQVNLLGPFLLSRAFVGPMLKRGWGRIINFTSAAALHPPGPLNSAYGTSKAALNQFTRHLASELVGTGVTANVLHPGDVKTEMWADIRARVQSHGPAAENYIQWADWVAQTGGDDPGKAAAAVLKLVSRESDYTNGMFIWIENGLQAPVPSWDAPREERPWM